MSVTEKEAFKLGFLARCAEERLLGDALNSRIAAACERAAGEKTAFLKFKPYEIGGASATDAGVGLLKNIGILGAGILTLPYIATPLAAGAAGYGAAKMVEPNISDDDVKAQELAATYKLYADKAKARRKSRKYRTGAGSEY